MTLSEAFKSGLLQALVYAGFLLVIGYFSAAPRYAFMDPALGLLRVNIGHAGARREPCRRYAPEEIARMAPNMRRAMDCVRERVALQLQLELDGHTLMEQTLPPAGLSRDGPSTLYARVPLEPGWHTLTARMRDSRRPEGFDHERSFEFEIDSGESRVLDFHSRDEGFRLL